MPIHNLPGGEEWDTTGKSLVAEVPDYYGDLTDGTQTSYWRLGAPIPGVENPLMSGTPGGDKLLTDGSPFPGWLEYTDGDRTIVTRGWHREVVGGSKVETLAGSYRLNIGAGDLAVYNADPVYKVEFRPDGPITAGQRSWRKYEYGHISMESYTFGDVESFFGGYKFDGAFGMTNNIFFGGKIDLTVAAALAVDVGFTMEVGIGLRYTRTIGKDMRVADDLETKARKEIHLRVKTTSEKERNLGKKLGAGFLFAAGAATAGALAGKGAEAGNVESDGFAKTTAACIGTAVIPFTLGLVGALYLVMSEKVESRMKKSKAEIKIEAKGIKIADNHDTTGNKISWIDVGNLPRQKPHILLKTTAKNWVELQKSGDVVVNGGKGVYLQTEKGDTLVQLQKNGNLRLIAKKMIVDAKTVDLTNVVRIRR